MSARVANPFQLDPYGAEELKLVARKYLVRSVMTGSTLWVLIFFLAVAASLSMTSRSAKVEHRVSIVVLPPLEPTTPPRVLPDRPPLPPPPIAPSKKMGAFVPVPVEHDRDVIIETPPPPVDPSIPTDQKGRETIVISKEQEEPPPLPTDLVNAEVLPEPIIQVTPEYPEFAKQAGVSGTVLVRALIGKDGRVRDAFVASSIPLLDDAALRAVRRWVFRPALNNDHPVMVWVAIPMKFTLR